MLIHSANAAHQSQSSVLSRANSLPCGCLTFAMMRIFLDADACPVKNETYRVATRFALHAFLVTCQVMRDPGIDGVTLVPVKQGPDLADDWIAEQIEAGDLCVSDDIPLASRCIRKGAVVVTARGRILHTGNIGELLATRDLLESLRNHQTLP